MGLNKIILKIKLLYLHRIGTYITEIVTFQM